MKYEDVKDIEFDSLLVKRKTRDLPKGISVASKNTYVVQLEYKCKLFYECCRSFDDAVTILEKFQNNIEQIKQKELDDHYKKPILYDDENNAIIQIKNRKG